MIKLSNFDLRPHHSLCIQFFVGNGYSQEFVDAMTRTIQMLNQKNPLVTLSQECDIICRYCPNNVSGKCLSHQKVSAIDQRCLDEYQLQFGDTINWNDLKQYAYEKIIHQNKLINVCQNCEWHTLCFT